MARQEARRVRSPEVRDLVSIQPSIPRPMYRALQTLSAYSMTPTSVLVEEAIREYLERVAEALRLEQRDEEAKKARTPGSSP